VKDIFYGGLIYCVGDTIATIISGTFYYPRMLGILMLGATLYAIEIPAYFRWLNRYFNQPGYLNAFKRMLMAAAFFNPLWIARHLVFIKLLSGQWQNISLNILSIASLSFLYCLPVVLPVNFLIQNATPLSWRFVASSVFSAFMAIYFSMSEVLFG
ncbi:MAG: hypothetical protein KAR12_14440, partial [Methylococcales bacterium]|nr:hypothetical protein [Methylococcales bacterium]